MDTQKKIKLVVSDIDGVWTDGGLYYDEKGSQIKKFNVKDGAAVKLLKTVGIPVCIITAKQSDMVARRAKEVGVEYIYQGVEKKLNCITELINNLSISFSEVAYIGDDFNDVPVLRRCLISAVPKDTSPVIKKEAKFRSHSKPPGIITNYYVTNNY